MCTHTINEYMHLTCSSLSFPSFLPSLPPPLSFSLFPFLPPSFLPSLHPPSPHPSSHFPSPVMGAESGSTQRCTFTTADPFCTYVYYIALPRNPPPPGFTPPTSFVAVEPDGGNDNNNKLYFSPSPIPRVFPLEMVGNCSYTISSSYINWYYYSCYY